MIGKRETNEDSHFIYLNRTKTKQYAIVDLFGIFDGHGGKEVSSFISKEFPKYMVHNSFKYPMSKKQVMMMCDKIQEKLKTSKYSYREGSTVLIAALFDINEQKTINIINSGDCRAVICNNMNIGVQLTKDHSPNSFSERNRIQSLGGNITCDEGTWRIKNLSVSRSFGDFDTFPFITHRPEMYTYVYTNELFLILACDGLWESLSNDDAVEFVLNNCYSIINKKYIRNKIQTNIAKQLAEHSIDRGSGDNISVIIIFLD